LHGSDRRADAQTAKVAQGEEQLLEGLVSEDELELCALEKERVRLFDLVDVSSSVLKLIFHVLFRLFLALIFALAAEERLRF